jgi:hypothetical protein
MEFPKADGTPIYDGYYRTTGQKTAAMTFRIYEEQRLKLTEDYGSNTSVLVRLLLEEFFAGRLPMVKIKFQQSLKANTPLTK